MIASSAQMINYDDKALKNYDDYDEKNYDDKALMIASSAQMIPPKRTAQLFIHCKHVTQWSYLSLYTMPKPCKTKRIHE